MIRKNNLDLEVAVRLGTDRKDIKLITDLFLEYLCKNLVADGCITIDGLGILAVQSYKVQEVPPGSSGPVAVTKVRVHFRKSAVLKRALHARIKEGESYGKVRR
jgi:nucleoid DNA-binding protein